MNPTMMRTQASALKALLSFHGVESKGAAILQAMEAPYLFLHRRGSYLAGTAFLSPDWLNNYLLPQGFRLTEHPLFRQDARSFLASHTPAVLLLPERKALVVNRCEDRRVCLAPSNADSAAEHWITFPTLLRKLPESFTALTLESCVPASVDMIPLLCESVRTLATYRRELAGHLSRTVTRQDMQTLHQQFFRALMVDVPALSHLYADVEVIVALHELSHIYRHLFIIGESEVHLRERLPINMINRCTIWLQELIIDRLHALGASDELLDPLYRETR